MSTAMQMVGHKTESIYKRHAIVDAAMLREAAARLDAWAQAPQASASTGTVTAFTRRRTRAKTGTGSQRDQSAVSGGNGGRHGQRNRGIS